MIENVEIYKLFLTYGLGFAIWLICLVCAMKYKNVIFSIPVILSGLLLYDLNIYIALIMVVIGIYIFLSQTLKGGD